MGQMLVNNDRRGCGCNPGSTTVPRISRAEAWKSAFDWRKEPRLRVQRGEVLAMETNGGPLRGRCRSPQAVSDRITRMQTHLTLLGLALAVAALLATAAPPADTDLLAPFPHPKGYVCYRAPSALTIDGDLTDAAWAVAPWSDAFVDIEGDRQPKPRFQTRVKLLWDDTGLYIAAELGEPHVWATLREHDAVIFHDNDFEVFLDPDGDNHLYGELELNALNTTWDLLLTKPYKDGGKAITAWEITGLKTAVKVNGTLNTATDTDTGWTLELLWPWKGLRELAAVPMPPKDGDQWRINFSRVEWDSEIADGQYRKVPNRPEHNWVWSPQGVIDMHRPERWGYLQFTTAKPGSVSFRRDPDWDVRDLLHRAYYAQRAYHAKNQRYAATVADLGLKTTHPLTFEVTRMGFEASLAVPEPAPRRWVITQDARIGKH